MPAVPPTVLVVDDDATLRAALESVLGGLGYRVLATGRAESAYDMLESQPADAAFLDVRLPDMSGLALYHALIHRHPHLDGRIAIMSADVDAEDVRGWLAAQQCAAFHKPFRPQPVIEWLEAVLRSRERMVS
jgi:DNA-binding response OmpR family regulator